MTLVISRRIANRAALVAGLVAACPFLSPPSAAAAVWEAVGPSLLPNGGFEEAMAKWFISGEKASASSDEQQFHRGRRSLRLTAAGRPAETRVIGFAAVDSAKKYRVTFAAKTADVGRDKRLSADFQGEMAAAVALSAYHDGRWLQWCPRPDAIALAGTVDWKTYSFDVLTLPADANRVQLHLILHNGARGTVWFDDVELKELELRRPSLVLASGAAANIFAADESGCVDARITNDASERDLTLQSTIQTTAGHYPVVADRRKMHLQPGEQRVERITLPGRVGHYVVTAELVGAEEQDRDRIEAAVVPTPSPQPCASLGLWSGDSALARKAGASWTREMAYWRYLEPEPGKYRWDTLDASLKRAKAAGLKVLLCFAQMTRWASTAPAGRPDFGFYSPGNWDDLSRFVEAVVRRYGPDVNAWEIWNEPVIPWGWKSSSEDVVTLHKVISGAIRRVQPQARIIGPCICQGTYPLLWLKAFQAVLPLGILGYCDGLAIHPYREPFGPEYTFFAEELGQLRTFARDRGIKQGLWITEIGWSTSLYPFWPKREVSELDQAAYLARSAVTAVAQEVQLFNWHAISEWDVPNPHEKHFGIVRAGMSGPKPAYVAYAVMARHLAGARCTGRLTGVGPVCPPDRLSRDKIWGELRPASVHSVDGYWFQRDGRPLLITWSISGRQETVNLRASGEVQVQDALGGITRVTPIGGRITLELSELPVYATGPLLKP